MQRKRSIVAQWFSGSFSAVAITLIIVDIAFFFLLRSYYYNAVRQYIETQANIAASVVERFYEETGTDYAEELRTAIEQFEKKEHAELMAVDRNGRVFLSSSGFSPAGNYDMPDYKAAQLSENKTGDHVGVLSNGERYMAYTVIHPKSGSAIRIITSLDRTDRRILGTALLVLAVSIGVLLLLLILGLYFVRSIVNPVLQLGKTAKKLATGDFSARIEVDRDDEIGELCTVFNYMADKLNNTENLKNEFISSVSHELRTPLTAIKGWSETLLEIDDRETKEKGIRIINKETERLSDMVEELLDFSRIQNGRFTLQTDNIDIIAELGDAVLMYEEKAKKEDIVLSFEENEAIAVVHGDKNRLRQVFINIIDNSIKYGKKGGRTDVKASVSDDSVVISIEDNGCGISAEDLPRVKEKFYKANNSVRGSGIGLAVADEIIRMHGGSIDITSVQGEGTTVSITLPTVRRQG